MKSPTIKEYFRIYQIDNIDGEFEKNVQYIMRRLLSAEYPVKMEQLQEELFLNMTNYIGRELAEVRKRLELYRLHLITIKKQGLIISGDYLSRCLCTVRVYKFFDDSIEPEFNIEKYSALFIPSFASKKDIKKIISETLLETRIVFSDIYLERFVLFFILLHNLGAFFEPALKNIDFNYTVTDEYQFVKAADRKMKNLFDNYSGSNEVQLSYLTYISIMSTDLYRIKDCVREKYDTLIDLAETIRTLIIEKIEKRFYVCVKDEITFYKDLLKILIPISMKIKLGVSDDVDLGYYNKNIVDSKPVVSKLVNEIAEEIYNNYFYELSNREKHIMLNVIYEFINNIELNHKKMRIALIAINGRISTQQIKFCIKKNFSSYVEKIETKVLYELGEMDELDYDCFLCMDYGKNMNIPYRPIYFFEEGMSDEDCNRVLEAVFESSYDYHVLIPKVEYIMIDSVYKIERFPVEKFLGKLDQYMCFDIMKNHDVKVHIYFKATQDFIKIYHYGNDDMDMEGIRYYIVIELDINDNKQKLKAILNLITSFIENPNLLKKSEKS